jgi:hypothetical protein
MDIECLHSTNTKTQVDPQIWPLLSKLEKRDKCKVNQQEIENCFTKVQIHHYVNPSLRWVQLLPKPGCIQPFSRSTR